MCEKCEQFLNNGSISMPQVARRSRACRSRSGYRGVGIGARGPRGIGRGISGIGGSQQAMPGSQQAMPGSGGQIIFVININININ